MGRALHSERLGDWEAALDHAARARELAPQAPAFAVLQAYYRTCRALEQDAPVPAHDLPDGPAPESQWSALAEALSAAADRPEELEPALGRLLTRYPYSLRGYYLMGLWRWKRLGEDAAAVLPVQRARELDRAYEPARRAWQAVKHAAPERTESDPTGGQGPLKALRDAAEKMEGKNEPEEEE
jgi:tetratricopeptide (TPR) repeat protein